jgi:hypothetical protein
MFSELDQRPVRLYRYALLSVVMADAADDRREHIGEFRADHDSLNSKMIFQAGSDQLRCY